RHLGLPRAITAQMPTTDTYSLPQSQQEFYFGLPYPLLDLRLGCSREGISAERAAPALGMRPEEVERIGRDIESKRRAAERLDGDALLAGDARRRHHPNGEEGNR
ncbi:MAG: synthetase, partial [Planctomycetota bacterium]